MSVGQMQSLLITDCLQNDFVGPIGKFDDLPNALAYVKRIGARPAYIKAMSIAGPKAPPKA